MDLGSPHPYFNINSDVVLVKGAKRGALYSLASGEVYSIDPIAAKNEKARICLPCRYYRPGWCCPWPCEIV
jgi:hypothetical protein